jgi:hypothetical protein
MMPKPVRLVIICKAILFQGFETMTAISDELEEEKSERNKKG